VAVVRSVVINPAELRNATVAADAPVWAAAPVVAEEAVVEVVEKEAAEEVAVGEGAADDAKPEQSFLFRS